MASVRSHENINLMSYAEVAEVSGYIGNFKVKVRKKPRYVDVIKCTGCGECSKACPVEVSAEFEEGLANRKAIYIPFAQAVPNKAVVDKREQLCFIACQDACPIHMNVPGYLRLIAQGNIPEAYQVIRKTNPLPSVCGWACYAPCEEACNRGQVDESPAIRDLKGFVSQQIDIDTLQVPEILKNGKKVAIIGSGPAGLAAAHDLALLGYSVTIFEALPVAGGMMRVAIPDYRLPKDALDKDIRYIERLGVEIKLKNKIDSLDRLLDQGYEAVLVALGAHQSLRRGLLVSAISGRPDALKGLGLQLERLDVGAVLKADSNTLATSKEGVFAAGDVTTGPTSVIHAIASGKKAAHSIDRYLKGEPMVVAEEEAAPQELTQQEIAALKDRLPAQQRLTGGYTTEQAQVQAQRCLGSLVEEGCWQCLLCEEKCEAKAINHRMKEEFVDLDVGNIIVATGFDSFDPSVISRYGYGRYDNVFTGLEFERMCNATGPTGGNIRLKDGSIPESVAILHCVGSRDKNYHEYCSRVCCMYALKFSHILKERISGVEVYQFYIDMRCFGKGYEEFYNRLLEEGVNFVRGKAAETTNVAETPKEKGKLIIQCEDILIGRQRRVPVDMVILTTAVEPRKDAGEVARMFSISRSKDGFFLEKHPKLDPVATTTDGVFIVGCCQGPKDIPDTVAQASAAAARVLALISKGKVEIEAGTSFIDEKLCAGCKICNLLCPYKAISFDEDLKVSRINEALCKGCGTCAAACPSGAITSRHFTTEQILAQIEGVLV